MLISLNDLISQSTNLCRNNWKKLSTYVLLLLLCSIVLILASSLGIYLDTYLPSGAVITSIVVIVLNIILGIFSLWTTLSLIKNLNSLITTGQSLNSKETFAATLPLIWPAIYTSLLAGLIILGGSLLFIIPGIIFTIWYIFVTVIIVVDNKKGTEALKYSHFLVKYRWWSIAMRYVMFVLIYAIAAMIIQMIISGIFSFFISTAAVLGAINSSISSVLSALISPLIMANLVILYHSAQDNPIVIPTPPTSTQK